MKNYFIIYASLTHKILPKVQAIYPDAQLVNNSILRITTSDKLKIAQNKIGDLNENAKLFNSLNHWV